VTDIREQGVDEIWNLGDTIGYGAQPDECVALAAEACDFCLVGNHDLVVLGEIDINDFSSGAALAAQWTRDHIAPETSEFLSRLSPHDDTHAIGLYHGSPRDPIWEYVLSTMQAELCFEEMQPRIGAVGHSHVALHFNGNDGLVLGEAAPADHEADLSQGRWLLNPGGVGQPRDGDPRAAWLLLDTERWTATWRRVEYPIANAAEAIEQAGLPQILADRLYTGQ